MRQHLEQLKKARKGVLLGLDRQVISCADILAACHATFWIKCTVKCLHHEVVNAMFRRLALVRHVQCQNLVSLQEADQELLVDAGSEAHAFCCAICVGVVVQGISIQEIESHQPLL